MTTDELIEKAAAARYPIEEDDPTTFGVRATLREGFKAGYLASQEAQTENVRDLPKSDNPGREIVSFGSRPDRRRTRRTGRPSRTATHR